jgi:7-cyano-7-deazaguanine synthase
MRTVVLLSGGLDSTLCLFRALSDEDASVSAITFDYGQTHQIEVARSQRIAHAVSVPLEVAHLWDHVDGDESVVPEEPGSVMPGRNALFLSYAANWARTKYGDEPVRLIMGACQEDQQGFPDCRPEFFAAMRLVFLASELRVEVEAPLIHMTKGDAINQTLLDVQKRGWGQVVPLMKCLAMTWSCYSPTAEDKPCMECGACRYREQGFFESDVEDPALC